MKKFKVHVQQYVEETATVEIEADTVEEAVDIAHRMLRNGEVEDWSDGDDTINSDVYAAMDEDGELAWER
jgi:hypothetical protein